MAKYILLYRGPATPLEDITPELGAEQAEQWTSWMGRVGKAMVDFGNPFGERAAVVDDGTSGEPTDLNGYSIIEADSLDAAKALVEGHPFLTEGNGRFAVEVFELAPVPGM